MSCKREASIPRVRLAAFVASVVVLGCPASLRADNKIASASDVSSIIQLVDEGEFSAAQTSIDSALRSSSLSVRQRSAYEFERERMRRILLDFSLTPSD